MQGEKIAGLTAFEWMKKWLADLQKESSGDGYVLTVDQAMPLLDSNVIRKAVKTINSKDLDGVVFGGGKLERSKTNGKKTVRVLSLETAVPDWTNQSEIAERLYYLNAVKIRENGVNILSPSTVFIDGSVTLGKCSIAPYVKISGNSVIEDGAQIESFSEINDSYVGSDSVVRSSVISNSFVGASCRVGPYAYIREFSRISDNCRIGDYVEIKNSTIGKGVKSAHHAYVGDAVIGDNTNVGCGTVFCNYNGKVKRKITVGKDVFIGSNVNLVAPLNVGKGAYIAAGSTVTKDVAEDSFVIARERETVKKRKTD